MSDLSEDLVLQPTSPAACVMVNITDDAVLEINEFFSVSTSSQDTSVAAVRFLNIFILDNDGEES